MLNAPAESEFYIIAEPRLLRACACIGSSVKGLTVRQKAQTLLTAFPFPLLSALTQRDSQRTPTQSAAGTMSALSAARQSAERYRDGRESKMIRSRYRALTLRIKLSAPHQAFVGASGGYIYHLALAELIVSFLSPTSDTQAATLRHFPISPVICEGLDRWQPSPGFGSQRDTHHPKDSFRKLSLLTFLCSLLLRVEGPPKFDVTTTSWPLRASFPSLKRPKSGADRQGRIKEMMSVMPVRSEERVYSGAHSTGQSHMFDPAHESSLAFPTLTNPIFELPPTSQSQTPETAASVYADRRSIYHPSASPSPFPYGDGSTLPPDSSSAPLILSQAQSLVGNFDQSFGTAQDPVEYILPHALLPSPTPNLPESTHFTFPPPSLSVDPLALPYTPVTSGHHTSLTPLVADWAIPAEELPFSHHPTTSTRPLGPMRSWSASSRRASALLMAPLPMQGGLSTPPAHFEAQSHHPITSPYTPYSYTTSASMSAIPAHPLRPIPDRRMSSPEGFTTPYTLYPLYAQHGFSSLGSGQRFHPAPAGLNLVYDDYGSDNRPARFKPTKEQLAVLIASYDLNKNPDAAAREALARQLGPEIRSKTLQIWFQNRRSKSRARERESASFTRRPSSLGVIEGILNSATGAYDPFTSENSSRKGSLVDMESLKEMVHDQDPFLHIVPISVLSISTWTRFLTPGMTASSDLCLALRLLCPSPEVLLYVSHKSDIYRINIPLIPAQRLDDTDLLGSNPTPDRSIRKVEAAANPTLNVEAVLVRFELAKEACTFSSWNATLGVWTDTGDFSGGIVGGGGKVEITGRRETLFPAFAKVHQHLYDTPLLTPVVFTHHQSSPSPPVTPTPTSSTADAYLSLRLDPADTPPQATFPSAWRFPAPGTAISADSALAYPSAPLRTSHIGARVRVGGMGHAKQRSLSAPMAMPAEFEAGRNDLINETGMGTLVEEYSWRQSAPNARGWSATGAGFATQQLPYQHQVLSDSPQSADAIGQGWPLYNTASSNNQKPSAHPYSDSSFSHPNAGISDASLATFDSHDQLSTGFSHFGRERRESVAHSVQSQSSSGSIMISGGTQYLTSPLIFDQLDAGLDTAGMGSGMMRGSLHLGEMGMEVLDEM